jgi:hypothetical protein
MYSSALSLSSQFSIPSSRQLNVAPGSLPRLLLEHMQHIDLGTERRHHKDAMLSTHVDSDFQHAMAHRFHRLPIARRPAILNEVELTTDLAPRGLRESAYVLE